MRANPNRTEGFGLKNHRAVIARAHSTLFHYHQRLKIYENIKEAS